MNKCCGNEFWLYVCQVNDKQPRSRKQMKAEQIYTPNARWFNQMLGDYITKAERQIAKFDELFDLYVEDELANDKNHVAEITAEIIEEIGPMPVCPCESIDEIVSLIESYDLEFNDNEEFARREFLTIAERIVYGDEFLAHVKNHRAEIMAINEQLDARRRNIAKIILEK